MIDPPYEGPARGGLYVEMDYDPQALQALARCFNGARLPGRTPADPLVENAAMFWVHLEGWRVP